MKFQKQPHLHHSLLEHHKIFLSIHRDSVRRQRNCHLFAVPQLHFSPALERDWIGPLEVVDRYLDFPREGEIESRVELLNIEGLTQKIRESLSKPLPALPDPEEEEETFSSISSNPRSSADLKRMILKKSRVRHCWNNLKVSLY